LAVTGYVGRREALTGRITRRGKVLHPQGIISQGA
jgi:hypothetical protein